LREALQLLELHLSEEAQVALRPDDDRLRLRLPELLDQREPLGDFAESLLLRYVVDDDGPVRFLEVLLKDMRLGDLVAGDISQLAAEHLVVRQHAALGKLDADRGPAVNIERIVHELLDEGGLSYARAS